MTFDKPIFIIKCQNTCTRILGEVDKYGTVRIKSNRTQTEIIMREGILKCLRHNTIIHWKGIDNGNC